MDSRVSTCCEFRHKCGKMLGSKSSHFRLVKLNGGKPCNRSVCLCFYLCVCVCVCVHVCGGGGIVVRMQFSKHSIGMRFSC